jgi:hypothetical protein
MQTEQKQTHHGGTGEQETELGSVLEDKAQNANASEPEGTDEGASARNPSGDDLRDAVDGDEGSGRSV